MQPWGVHMDICSPRIFQAGRILLAKVWHANDWTILSDLWNLQNISNYSSAKTIAPTCLISPSHLSSTSLSWHLKNAFFFGGGEGGGVYFASLAMMSADESFLSRRRSYCTCLSTLTSKGQVDMFCNQSRSIWWSIQKKKKKKKKAK